MDITATTMNALRTQVSRIRLLTTGRYLRGCARPDDKIEATTITVKMPLQTANQSANQHLELSKSVMRMTYLGLLRFSERR
jgi:hypothetical protein